MEDYDKDLFIKQLTYLPFKDVISLCQSNSKFHNYCVNINYNNSWKKLIDNTFSDISNYQDKLNQIWLDKKLEVGTYNYIVYTQLINYLDPITQLMIYYKQKDMESFENKKFDIDNNTNIIYRFLALFLLNDKDKIMKYLPNDKYLPFVDMLNGKQINQVTLNNMLIKMANRGNLLGVKLLRSKGADIHANYDEAFREASENGHLDIVRYLLDNGVDIHIDEDLALGLASKKGHLDVVRYLLDKGADIHADDDYALRMASSNGHLDTVIYLIENGADIHARNDAALREAIFKGHLEIVKYLKSLY